MRNRFGKFSNDVASLERAEGCTGIMAGKKATGTGISMIARNEDMSIPSGNKGQKKTQNVWNKYLAFRKEPAYANIDPLKDWILGNGLKVPAPEARFTYSAIPDAVGYTEATHSIGNRFYFEERGINQCNVAISATNSMDVNERANAADPLVENGIEESIIPTLLLPQAATASQAVELLGKYVEECGAGEGNGILIGDPNESWYFEIGSRRHWIAVKVPEDSYLVVANDMRVHDVDLDSKDVKHSKGLFEFVQQNNLLANPDAKSFNFARAFGVPGDPYNTDRVWLAQKILSPKTNPKPRQCQYPLFLNPDEKISVTTIMQVLRANYKNTELEGIAERTIGADHTAESHIITLDAGMPGELQGLIWQTMGTPLSAPYLPLYNVMDDIPPSYAAGDNVYSPSSAYWAFKGLYALSRLSNLYKKDLCGINEIWDQYEQELIDEHVHVEKTLKEMYASNRQKALDFAKRYSIGIAYRAERIANDELDKLITKIARLTEKVYSHGESTC